MTKTLETFVLLLLAACGDNFTRPDGAVHVDAAPIDGVLVRPPRAIVVAGDFTAGHPGVLSSLDVDTRMMMMNVGPAMSVGNDPILRHAGNELLIVNRSDGNNVTIVDDTTLQLKEQLATGASSNPQDVAVLGNKLYVAAFGTKGVLELTRGTTTRTEIDLSADDPDGKPNCNSVFLVDGDLYVSCELLDDSMQFLPPRGPGKVYVVDPGTRAIKKTITMANKNPFGVFEQIPTTAPHPGDLVIPTVFFDDGSGCVERIATGANAASAGCIVTNAELGGFASRVAFYAPEFTGPITAIIPSQLMFATVPASDFIHADLRVYDMTLGNLTPDAVNPTTQVIGDVAVCEATAHLIVSDTTASAAGLRVYSGLHEETNASLPIGLKPLSAHGIVCY